MSERKNSFAAGATFNPADFPKKKKEVNIHKDEVAQTAYESGFTRDPLPSTATRSMPVPSASAATMRRPGRPRTGRNYQLNVKVKPETAAALEAIADHNGWGFGETLEYMIEAWQHGGE